MTRALSHSVRMLLGLGLATCATTGAALANGGVYLESGGLLVIQLESAPTVASWALSTQTPQYTGDGYIRWDGANEFYNPGGAGLFGFTFEITNPGTYYFNLRNRHEHPNPTEENDVWVRLDNQTWEKVFSNGPPSVGGWVWESRIDLGGGLAPQQSYYLTAGVHTLWFSGRSTGFKMDRFHLAFLGHPDEHNELAPESPCRIGQPYGNPNANSTGLPGEMHAIGSLIASENDVTLHGSQLPVAAIGYFIVSNGQLSLPGPGGSSGMLLVGPSIGRYSASLRVADGMGRVSMPVDLTQIPRPTGPVPALPGQTWYFQFWHRDAVGGVPTSNFTRALALTFS